MALYVNTNISSLNAQRKLANATNNLNTSYQRLSSGLRINSAKDDAAGLMISNRLSAQINGLNQGNRNANDGIAMAQTIESSLEEQSSMLQRIRTLAVQAANGTNTDEDRYALQEEVNQLSYEICRIAKKTTFAGSQILDGTVDLKIYETDNAASKRNVTPPPNFFAKTPNLDFQVGSNAFDTLSLDMSVAFKLTTIMNEVTDEPSINLHWMEQKKDFWERVEKAASDGNFCGLVVTQISDSIFGRTTARWCISSQSLAQNTLKHIDKAIAYIDSRRSELGAIQNRMESTIRNQSSISENEADARSRIRDTDFAEQTAILTANNIMQQASQTVLAQANQRPNVALSLLQNN